ncbi:uncharacterized protein LOC123558545 [Mercenaria mercenaria]|uniref:uncharacterized protein LOC123558545 n=1 Tax=Mercenaria mercenaria TaxID=6596 RepID=UPI00234F97E7|nr:uncharacterized protein LOC123558545 [Mercenaria mercenaria]
MANSDSVVEFNIGQRDGRDVEGSPHRRICNPANNEDGERIPDRRHCCRSNRSSISINPDKFDGEDDWEQYISNFEDCAELGQWTEKEMLLTLSACLKGQTRAFYTSLAQREKRTYGDLTFALEQRFGSARQQSRWLTKFQTRLKLVGESVAAFGDDLRLLARKAYDNLEPEAQEMLALQQFNKALSVEMKCRVMDRDCKTITEAVEVVERYQDLLGESNQERRRNIVRQVGNTGDDGRVKMQDDYKERRVSWRDKDTRQNDGIYRTLKSIQIRLDRIERGSQARNRDTPRRCYNCQSLDHISWSCPDRHTQSNGERSSRTARIGKLGNNSSKFDNGLFVNGKIDQTPVDFLVGTGSTVTLISKSKFDQLNRQHLPASSTNIQGVDGTKINVYGRDTFVITIGDAEVKHNVIVCDMAMEGIIGQDFIMKHVKSWDMDNLKLKLRSGENVQCVTQSEAERVCRIIVTGTLEIPPNSYGYVKVTIPNSEHLAKTGYVENCEYGIEDKDSVSLTEGVVDPHRTELGVGVVNNSDTTTVLHPGLGLGFCKSSYEECENEVADCANITEDNTSDQESQPVPEYLKELFEKSSVRLNEDEKPHLAALLNKYKSIFVTSSDELRCTDKVKHKIYTGSAQHVKQAPRRQPLGKRVNEKEEVERMLEKGIIEPSSISEDGISTDDSKTEAVRNWPIPVNAKQVRSFLGLAGYYRKFVKGYAEIARPLHRLCEKKAKFLWTEDCQNSFEDLNEALTTAPVLSYPKPECQFILDTDSSDNSTGAILSQVIDDKEHVIAYMSKKMNKHEQQYCITRKELLAVVRALKQFHHYLYGRDILLRTDNSAVSWMRTLKSPNGQTARWLQELETYNLTVVHRPGRQHSNADALSRVPCTSCKRQQEINMTNEEVAHEITSPESNCEKLNDKNNPPEEDDELTRDTTRSENDKAVANEIRPHQMLLDGWSPTDIRAEQAADADISKVFAAKISSSARPQWSEVSSGTSVAKTLWRQWDRLEIKGGMLYRKFANNDGSITWQLVVPKRRQDEVMHYSHDIPSAAHLGSDKTLNKVRQSFYWPGVTESVKKFCQLCDTCTAHKLSKEKTKAPLGQYIVGEPMERVVMDILGPLPQTNNGNRFILVISDWFTKWVECVPISN